jgi:hypothetical protein
MDMKTAQKAIRWAGVAALALVAASCRPPAPPASAAPCLIGSAALPAGWYMDGAIERYDIEPRPLPGDALDGRSVQFRHDPSGALAHHEVLVYGSAAQAARAYQRQSPGGFFNAGRLTPWEPPELTGYQDRAAAQSRLACAEFEVAGRFRLCIARALYGRYLSIFSTWMGADCMTEPELAQALQAVAHQVAFCASGP